MKLKNVSRSSLDITCYKKVSTLLRYHLMVWMIFHYLNAAHFRKYLSSYQFSYFNEVKAIHTSHMSYYFTNTVHIYATDT